MTGNGNPYLTGLFAPVRDEITAHSLPVIGRIPASLNGRFLRNGPNPLSVEDPAAHHWFMGAGMVHGVRLRDGAAEWYRNRWVRSDAVAAELGEKQLLGPRHQDMDAAANTHILRFGGRYLATVESGPLPYELDEELNTLGPYDFQGTLPGGFAAHTIVDPASGELHAVAYCPAYPYVEYLVAGTDGRIKRRVDIPVEGSPMMHDFSLTENYVLLYDLPVGFSMDAAEAGASFPFGWNPAKQARLGLLPREGRAEDVRWLDIDPCFVFHPMNAYEEDGGPDGRRIVIHLVAYDRLFDTGRHGPDDSRPRLERWTVDLRAGSVRQEVVDDRPMEFPRVDPRLMTGKFRYGYGVLEPGDGYGDSRAKQHIAAGTSGPTIDRVGIGLVKYDLERGSSEVHRVHPDGDVSEGVFVPGRPDLDEDDGYVLAYAFDPERAASDLLILSAQDLSGEPVARVQLPVRVPIGFHGNWMADEE
ncbi:carotenoid oxygenase family protein [Streptomyces sp. NBC_01304]|uniref:carotenoid oxygenase family protein n=1 Tax=Streptomyces sp. NBC_01304 TaxID=2903818 RepID=UPI002E0F162C|nr:carotenoid oxygenase family protein [Streptomyces sp. NBC_01304]